MQSRNDEIQELLKENKKLIEICATPATLISWITIYYSVSAVFDVKFDHKIRLAQEYFMALSNNPALANDPKFQEDFLATHKQEIDIIVDKSIYKDCSRVIMSLLSPVVKSRIYNPFSAKHYQRFFYPLGQKNKNPSNGKLINDLKKQNIQLEMIANRNITVARYSMLIILPLAIYMIMSLDYKEPTKYADNIIDIIAITTIALSILNVALKNCVKDVKTAWNLRKLNLEINEAQKKVEKVIPKDLILRIKRELGHNINDSSFTITFNREVAKRKVVGQLIKFLLVKKGMTIVSSDYDTLRLSAGSINSLLAEESENINKSIHDIIFMVKESEHFVRQMKKFAIANNSKVTFIPSYNKEGERFIECYFYNSAFRIETMKDQMLILFPDVKMYMDGDNMHLVGNKPCDDKLFNELLVKKNTSTMDDSNNEIQINNPSQKYKNKTSRNISKQLEQQAEKSIITPEKTVEPGRADFQSGTYDPGNNKCRTTILSGNGLPYGRFYLTSKLTKNDFPDNDDSFKKVNQKIANSKKANARQNAEGVIFIDPIEVKCDNKDSSFVAEAKIKFKGNHGDMRVFMRKESNDEGKVLYIAEGVMKKTHK